MSTLLRSLSVPGYGQLQVSEQRRMPVDDGTTANIQTVTGETVQFFYYDATTGVLTQDAGQAAGVVVVANLTNKNLLNNLGDVIGSYGDSSFAFTTGTILTALRPFRGILAEQTEQNGLSILKAGQLRANSVTDGFKNGEYCIDHERGVIYGKKATTGTSDTGTYKVLTPGGGAAVPENVNIAKVNGTTTFAGQTANGTTVTGFLNDLPMARYNATPTARTEGQFGNLQSSANGGVNTNAESLTAGEDIPNNVLQVIQKPLAGTTYSFSRFINFGANATLNVKATSGNVMSLSCHNLNAASRYLQLHNTATTPAPGASPLLTFLVPAGSMIVIGNDFFGMNGLNFSTGIAFAFSTVEATYTAGTAADQYTQLTYA